MGLRLAVALLVAAIHKVDRHRRVAVAGVVDILENAPQIPLGLVDVQVELLAAGGAVDGAVAALGVVPDYFPGQAVVPPHRGLGHLIHPQIAGVILQLEELVGIALDADADDFDVLALELLAEGQVAQSDVGHGGRAVQVGAGRHLDEHALGDDAALAVDPQELALLPDVVVLYRDLDADGRGKESVPEAGDGEVDLVLVFHIGIVGDVAPNAQPGAEPLLKVPSAYPFRNHAILLLSFFGSGINIIELTGRKILIFRRALARPTPAAHYNTTLSPRWE